MDNRCSASRSKGFCFLEYEDVLAAESAVQVLNGTPLANRMMRVGISVMRGFTSAIFCNRVIVPGCRWADRIAEIRIQVIRFRSDRRRSRSKC